MDSHTGRALEGSGILGRPAEEQRRLVAEFSDRARAVAARVSEARSLAEAARIIAETADAESPAGRYIATSDVIAAYPDLGRELGEHGVKLESDIEAGAEAAGAGELAAALMGGVVIVAGRTGVAETGSVLVGDFSLSARLVEMLAETCYVLLPAHAVLPGLDEMGKLLAEKTAAGDRYLSLVTGPSRSADIERVLTIGVQGPRELHIIVLHDGGDGE